MSSRSAVTAAIALAALLALIVVVRGTAPGPDPEIIQASDAAPATKPPTPVTEALALDVQPPAIVRATPLSELPPRSLIGSDPDGEFSLDASGELRIDLALRRWFDWHRAAIGELDAAAIRRRIASALQAQLPPDQVAHALDVYDNYLAYLAASDQLAFDADPLAQLDALRAIRRQWLGASVADAFFADEELALEARLLRRSVARDSTLDRAERNARLAAIDASLPDELKPSPEVRLALQSERLSAAYDAAGVSAEERFAERSELFGADAAGRLGALDAERRHWQQRVDDYATLQTQVQRNPQLSDLQRRQALQDWLQQHFDEAEQRRLQALLDEGELGG